MKNKLIIEGKEFDLPQSLVDEIKEKLSPKPNIQTVKKLTYEDVAKELFEAKKSYYTDSSGEIRDMFCYDSFCDPNNTISKKQAEKILAINKLINVAKYLNKEWKPDWKNLDDCKYYINIDETDNIMKISPIIFSKSMDIYFKTKELAQQAINILGEETIRLALSTNY
jgi:hypothetical protein